MCFQKRPISHTTSADPSQLPFDELAECRFRGKDVRDLWDRNTARASLEQMLMGESLKQYETFRNELFHED